MCAVNDNDMKIFHLNTASDVNADTLAAVAEMDKQRQNGNSDKARRLGKYLAKAAFKGAFDRDMSNAIPHSDPVLTQVGVLMLFTTEAALNSMLPSTVLPTIAISSLHNHLHDMESEFHQNVTESSAYSFYYLSLRKNPENVAQGIGETFAMLCQHAGEEAYIKEGIHIYEITLHEVEKQVNAMEFAIE